MSSASRTEMMTRPVGESPQVPPYGLVDEWLSAVEQAAKASGYLTGLSTNLAQEMDDYDSDDSLKQIPASKQALDRLKVQFLTHLAMAFGDDGAWNAPTIGLLHEDPESNAATIRLTRMSTSGECPDLLHMTAKFAEAFKNIHGSVVSERTTLSEVLEEVVFRLYRTRLLRAISLLRNCFQEHRNQIDDTTSKMLGLHDDEPQARDTAIGDRVIALNASMHSVESTSSISPENILYKDDQIRDIMSESWRLYRLEKGEVHERMRIVLGSPLADTIYENVLILVQPTRSVRSFVHCAKALKCFATVKFKRGFPPVRPPGSASTASSNARAAHLEQPSLSSVVQNANSDRAPTLSDNAHYTSPKDRALTLAHQYLGPTNRHMRPADLHPPSKQYAFELVIYILERQIPAPKSDAYYLFGFVACRTEHEIQLLGGLYWDILKNAPSKVTVFADLSWALHSNQLSKFFDRYGWETFRQTFPRLERFLTTPLHERQSVYRLVQFLRIQEGKDIDSDPPRVLIRDFGFHRCRMREEVEILKELYRQALAKIDVLDLHDACVHNQLLRAVTNASIQVPPEYRRFLVNQSPLPDVGFEKIISRFQFDQGLFKREKIRRMRKNLG